MRDIIEADRKIAAAAVRLTRRIVAAPALAGFTPEEFKPGPQFQSDAELMQVAGENT